MAVLLLVLKVVLIAFIVGGTAALVVRAVRRSRANRLDPRWKPRGPQPGYEASAHGAMPHTPLPEWAHWDEEGEEDGTPR
ncbi:hypothetical protein [Mycobacterium sp. E2989]|uniref:hypothetical protein n=1 Tax=Mycobacterium sp. E2989 TaxID=1834140 RepID=UPI0007FDCC66|nr:hypothetical protein [Mycobacterium sp. E2989]OBH89942.1 hypothetical protein A5680_20460 [Mycobacterium sp. E2989]